MTTTKKTEVECPKCLGKKHFEIWSAIANGVCFTCAGNGTIFVANVDAHNMIGQGMKGPPCRSLVDPANMTRNDRELSVERCREIFRTHATDAGITTWEMAEICNDFFDGLTSAGNERTPNKERTPQAYAYLAEAVADHVANGGDAHKALA
jgi:hypothetical protein